MDDARLGGNARITVDLHRMVVIRPNGDEVAFDIDPHQRHALLEGIDEIGQTLRHTGDIDAFEARRKAEQSWYPAIA